MTEKAVTTETVSDTSSELMRPDDRFSDDTLAGIGSFSDALNLLTEEGSMAEDFATTYGTGFRVLDTKDKGRLVGVEFAALEWSFNLGDNGEFVSIAVMTETGEKLILNDGSTGIYQQMVSVTRKRLDRGATRTQACRGLRVRDGLRASEYPVKSDGTPLTRDEIKANPELAAGKGVTYYLAN